jgi:hypothetical protein
LNDASLRTCGSRVVLPIQLWGFDHIEAHHVPYSYIRASARRHIFFWLQGNVG